MQVLREARGVTRQTPRAANIQTLSIYSHFVRCPVSEWAAGGQVGISQPVYYNPKSRQPLPPSPPCMHCLCAGAGWRD